MDAIIDAAGGATVMLGYDEDVTVANLTLIKGNTLEIEPGATVSATGNFSDAGSITFDAGGSISVGGNLTESSLATFNEQIDSVSDAAQFGTLAVTGTATLAGTFNLVLESGYIQEAGQDYKVMTFASASGTFSTVTGLTGSGGAFTLTVETNSLDLIFQPTPPTFTADTPPLAAVGSAYSYQFEANGTTPITFTATGLPSWAQLNENGELSGTPPSVGTFKFTVTARNGVSPNASVKIALVAQLEPPTFIADTLPVAIPGTPFTYQFQATGTGVSPITYTAADLPSWAQLDPSTGVFSGTPPAAGTYDFSVTASNGIAPDTTVSVWLLVASGGTGVTFNIAAGTTLTIPAGTYVGGTTFDVGAGAMVTIEGGSFSGGTTFDVGAGAMVTIEGGSFSGGVVFNVDLGAVVDLTGGNSATYSGTLVASGAGTVETGDGEIYVGLGGLTLAFPGDTFQWTGGVIDTAVGDVTNTGTMNLVGSTLKAIFNDGTLFNYGTVIQTGGGNLLLHSDGVALTSVVNEAGASYLIESDSYISGGAIQNAGTLEFNSAVAGIATLAISELSNTGTIEAACGSLEIGASTISQVTGGALTGGTWSAQNGATLQMPSDTNISTNAGNLSLGGNGADITGISDLTSSSGSLTLTGGADFTTTGDFTNSGTLTVGAGSTFSFAGNETETSVSTLGIQIGGTPASGQFGQLTVQGTATLAGTIALNAVNGFSASAGQDFKVMTFASGSGSFSTALGFGSTFTEAVNPTSLDLYAFRNPTDLKVSKVAVPATAITGQQVTITWQVTNQGPSDAAGNWQDSVFISATPMIDTNSTLLGATIHSGGLAVDSSYSGTLTVTLPALAPAAYYVLVQADSLYQVPDPSRADSTTAAGNQLKVTLPELTLGTPAQGAFTAADQNQYYQITVPAGGSLEVALDELGFLGALSPCMPARTRSRRPTVIRRQQQAQTCPIKHCMCRCWRPAHTTSLSKASRALRPRPATR